MLEEPVRLRPIEEADLDRLRRFDIDPSSKGPYLSSIFRSPQIRPRRWEEDGWLGDDFAQLAVALPDGMLAGIVSWRSIQTGGPDCGCLDIGALLFPEYRGRGLGTAAQRPSQRDWPHALVALDRGHGIRSAGGRGSVRLGREERPGARPGHDASAWQPTGAVMAERHLWPAVLAGGWRSRPGVVRVAAGLLVLFGLLLVLVEAGKGQLEVVVVVTGLVLLAAAVALVWAGRHGYWLGLTVAAVLALLVVAALTRNRGIGGVIVTALGGLPLTLLLLPAARRPRRTTGPASASATRHQLSGWTRPFAGWGQFAFMLVAGGLLSAGGVVMTLTGQGAERGAGATIAHFSFACFVVAPLFAPGRRHGRLRLETLRVGDRNERGIVVPHSGWRTALLLGGIACLALASLGFVVFADAFADDPGQSPWPMRLLGAVGLVFFGAGGLLFLRRGWGNRWRVLLTPSAVVIAAGGARTVVPWEAIQQVQATQVTTHVRGVEVREPLIGLDVSDLDAIQTGRLERLLLPLSRRLGTDLALPIRTLDIDPPLLYQALRYYYQHPQARAKLATPEGLARVQHGQFTTTQPASR